MHATKQQGLGYEYDAPKTTDYFGEQKQNSKLEAKDVLPNINRTQVTERTEKCRFVPGDLDL